MRSLNPYQNKWAIHARVMSKNKRTYHNAKGEGKLFNIDVQDATGDIRISGFNEVVDQYFDKLEVGKCFLISGGQLKAANPMYNKTSHGFEVTLNRGCTIEEIPDDGGLPQRTYTFVPISTLEHKEIDSHVDVLAIVCKCAEPNTYTNKNGREVTKRVMDLVDASGMSIEATMFGEGALNLKVQQGVAIAIKGAKVGSWNTKSLTLWGDTVFDVNPDLPEAHSLMGWWQHQGANQQPRHLSEGNGGGGGGAPAPRVSFTDIEDKALGLNAQADYFSVNCYITHVKTDKRSMWYIACPNCKKKVSSDDTCLDGHCEKCDKPVVGTRRWIFSAQCNDTSGSRYISFFDAEASRLLGGKTADEMAPIKFEDEQNGTENFNGHFKKHCFQRYTMRCSARSDNYNDETRIKISCVALQPLNFVQEGRNLLTEIQSMIV